MDCLKRAMKWDEERFGLELDLEQYKIVAGGDFKHTQKFFGRGQTVFSQRFQMAYF